MGEDLHGGNVWKAVTFCIILVDEVHLKADKYLAEHTASIKNVLHVIDREDAVSTDVTKSAVNETSAISAVSGSESETVEDGKNGFLEMSMS